MSKSAVIPVFLEAELRILALGANIDPVEKQQLMQAAQNAVTDLSLSKDKNPMTGNEYNPDTGYPQYQDYLRVLGDPPDWPPDEPCRNGLSCMASFIYIITIDKLNTTDPVPIEFYNPVSGWTYKDSAILQKGNYSIIRVNFKRSSPTDVIMKIKKSDGSILELDIKIGK